MGKSEHAGPIAKTCSCVCCNGSGGIVFIGTCPLCDGSGYFECDTAQNASKLCAKAAKARALDISRSLSMLLRHAAQEQGVAIDEQGWVLLNDALDFLNKVDEEDPWEGGPVIADEICAIAASSDKQRFVIWNRTPAMIRASQGHSMKGIEPDLEPLNVAEVSYAVHGTYYKVWNEIKSYGLNRMNRNYIHLARDLPGDSGVISGMRGSCEILIWVDLAKADAAGLKFEQSANGVILTKGNNGALSPEFFCKVVDRETNASLLG